MPTSENKFDSLFAYNAAQNRGISARTSDGNQSEWLERIRNSSFNDTDNHLHSSRAEINTSASNRSVSRQTMHAILPTTDQHSVESESAVSVLLNQMAIECECRSLSPCSKCGIVNCWSGETNSSSESCQKLFDSSGAAPIRVGSYRSNVIMEATSFDAVLDFDCDHVFAKAVFHAVVDCFNVQLSMVAMVLHRNQNMIYPSKETKMIRHVAIVSSENTLRYMELLCLTLKTHGIEPTFISPRSGECLVQHFSSNRIAFTDGYQSWFVVRTNKSGSPGLDMTRLTGGRLFAALVRQNYHEENSTCNKIVILLRERSRRFRDQTDFLAALHSNFGRGNILVYQGNESFAQTVSIFRHACAVVGYHGAGAINMFFTPPGTLCLEMVIFDTSSNGSASNWRPWRSNERRISQAAGSKWQLKLIEPHHFWIPKKNESNPVKNGDVQLTREHIADILWRLESHLEHSNHGLVQRKSALLPVKLQFRIPDVRLGFR
jgi:hypothetical protein